MINNYKNKMKNYTFDYISVEHCRAIFDMNKETNKTIIYVDYMQYSYLLLELAHCFDEIKTSWELDINTQYNCVSFNHRNGKIHVYKGKDKNYAYNFKDNGKLLENITIIGTEDKEKI